MSSERFRGAARWLGLPGHWLPATLSEQTVRELCAFRVSVMGLKPETDPEQDYVAFRECLRRCEFVWVDEHEGDVVGMYAFVLRTLEHEGVKVVVWEGEYACVAPNHRSGWKIVASGIASLMYMWLRFRGHRAYIFGAAYLPSFLMLQHAGPVYLHDDPSMSAWERSLLNRLAAEHRGWDPATGWISLPTLPVNPRHTPPRAPELREPWERYLAHNPRWHHGFASAVLKPLSGMRGLLAKEAVRVAWARIRVP
jgi:hypothetical protein